MAQPARITYFDRRPNGSVTFDGVCVSERFNVDVVPNVGDTVVLPFGMLKRLREARSTVQGIRFEVIFVEHRWEDLGQMVCIGIAELRKTFHAMYEDT